MSIRYSIVALRRHALYVCHLIRGYYYSSSGTSAYSIPRVRVMKELDALGVAGGAKMNGVLYILKPEASYGASVHAGHGHLRT